MEIKVLIVDDETPVREWIEYCITQSGLPYRITGLAANGAEALEIFLAENPDVIITDIRMPIMDGMELIKEAKRLKQDVKTVILTCHDDFEYARNALKYGADEYILKTEISKSQMYELLKGIIDKISHKSATGTVDEGKILTRDLYLRHILTEDSDFNITELALQNHNILLKEGPFFAVAVKSFDSVYNEDIQHKLYDFVDNITYFPYDKNTFVLVANIERKPSTLLQIDKINKFALFIRKHVGGTIGISRIYERLAQLGEAINESLLQLNQEFYNGEVSVNMALLSPVTLNPGEQEEKFSVLKRTIQSEGLVESLEAVENHLEYIDSVKMPDIEMLKRMYQKIGNMLYVKFTNEIDISATLNELNQNIAECTSFKAFKDIFKNLADLLRGRTESKRKTYSIYVANVLDFINENYASIEGLTQVAKVVRLNPEYFSRLFKEETGCNFNAYLTGVRMKKAMQLLQTSPMKIYEISETVGYQNLSYFSRVFKKYYGANPFDYRKTIEK